MSELLSSEITSSSVGTHKRADTETLAAEINALGEMTYADLRLAWRRLYRVHPPKKLSRDLLVFWIKHSIPGRRSSNVCESRTQTQRYLVLWPFILGVPNECVRTLELGVAWKMQERVLGGLSAATKRQLAELARSMATKSDLAKARTVTLRPGARLVRDWGGETHEILIVEDGFLWRGKTWRSLSAIAREMTGTHWSGPRFFGLTGAKTKSVAAADTEDNCHE